MAMFLCLLLTSSFLKESRSWADSLATTALSSAAVLHCRTLRIRSLGRAPKAREKEESEVSCKAKPRPPFETRSAEERKRKRVPRGGVGGRGGMVRPREKEDDRGCARGKDESRESRRFAHLSLVDMVSPPLPCRRKRRSSSPPFAKSLGPMRYETLADGKSPRERN